jgi:hypothetical protein
MQRLEWPFPLVNLQSLATGARRRSSPGFAATHDRGSSSLVAEARSHHHRGSPSPVVGALAARRQSSQSSVSSSSCWDSPPPYRLCPCHPRSSGSHHACGVRLKITWQAGWEWKRDCERNLDGPSWVTALTLSCEGGGEWASEICQVKLFQTWSSKNAGVERSLRSEVCEAELFFFKLFPVAS